MKILLTVLLFSISLSAQVPVATLNIGWDAVPGATSYRLTVDGTTQDVGFPPINPTCSCPSVTLSVIPAATHSISVIAYSATSTSAASIPLALPSTCLPGRGLSDCWAVSPAPLQWNSDNVGFVNPPGQSVVVSNNFALSAGGLAMAGIQDGFYFLHQSSSANGSLAARIVSIGPAGKAGLDWREDMTAISRHVSIALTSTGTLEMTSRNIAGTASRVVTTVPGMAAPIFLRIVRSAGNSFAVSRSADGVLWNAIGTVVVPMAVGTQVGLFTLGASTSVAMTSQFSNVIKVP